MRFVVSTHTPLARRNTHTTAKRLSRKVSTHTPLAGRNKLEIQTSGTGFAFLLIRLLRGATQQFHPALSQNRFLLIRLLRGATSSSVRASICSSVSTHTPLARRNVNLPYLLPDKSCFYSYASCEAQRMTGLLRMKMDSCFYSYASCEAQPLYIVVLSFASF